jgi:hypothetical protein
MPDKPGLKFVRCQVPPDVHAAARAVAAKFDWNVPAAYTAMACYCMLVIGPDKFAALVEEQLERQAQIEER